MQICYILLRKQLNKYKNLYRNIFAEYKQAQEDTSPAKVDVTSKSPVGDISVVTLIKINTTLDHSQKAENFNAISQTCGSRVASGSILILQGLKLRQPKIYFTGKNKCH